MNNDNIKIIIIDDEPLLLESIKEYFNQYNITTYSDPKEALNEMKTNFYDIIITDYKMPKINGIELLMALKKNNLYTYAILLTAYADKDILEEIINENLINKIIEKPIKFSDLKLIFDSAIDFCIKQKEKEKNINIIKNNYLSLKEELKFSLDNIIGLNKGLKNVYEKILSIAHLPITVLITGETGTGKELIAKAIHQLSPRRDYPFIKINSTAIPDTLFESELFGYKKGAFSNATIDKPGKIELADKGTLFLDEIGDININLQSKLLRVIQEKEVERLGSNNPIKVDFRLIVATNKDLLEAIKNNTFREDLYYRINDFPINLPPLRDRKGDIEDLIFYFINKISIELNKKNIKIAKETIERLKQHNWPGNIRELENAIKRAIIALNQDRILLPADFDFLFCNYEKKDINLNEAISILAKNIINKNIDLEKVEELIINDILSNFNNNVFAAVEKTNISKNKFYKYKKIIKN